VGVEAEDEAGTGLSSAGDQSGDGLDDVAVGSPWEGQFDEVLLSLRVGTALMTGTPGAASTRLAGLPVPEAPVRFALLVPLLAVLLSPALPTEAYGADAPEKAAKKKKKKKGAEGGGDDDKPPFAGAIDGKERSDGLFDLYRDPESGETLLAIGPDQLDTDFMLSSAADTGVGERGLYGSVMLEGFVFRWHRMGDRMQLVRRNLAFTATPGSPEARAVARSFADSVIASTELASSAHPESGEVLVDASALFLGGDLSGYGGALGDIYEGGFELDPDNSIVELARSFPRNTELGVVARFAGEGERGSAVLSDDRTLSVTLRYSLAALPDDGYTPRLADDRLGYFTTSQLDWSQPGSETPYRHWINRWRLEKSDPDADVSDAKAPIVYWIENSVPERYRPFVKEGIEMWAPAFEAAGVSKAIVAKQQPDDADWDPADIRYNTIRWFVTYDANFAVGPSHADPRTGELIAADISFSDGLVRVGAHARHRYWVDPVSEVQGLVASHQDEDDATHCTFADDLGARVGLAHTVLSTRPGWTSEDEERFVGQYVAEVTAHEVGHTLGLRHNFLGSTRHDLESVINGDGSLTALTASVMDYNPPVVAREGAKQGPFLQTAVGDYDRWVIEYGYTPLDADEEAEALTAIASRATEPNLAYATDEDAGFRGAVVDPRVNRYDYGSDPLAWYTYTLGLVRTGRGRLADVVVEDGESWAVLRRAFDFGWRDYTSGGMVAAKYVGGMTHRRFHKGDAGGQAPFVPVARAEQERALDFLDTHVWAKGAYDLPDGLLERLQPERHLDLEWSIFQAPRLDYPIHDVVAQVQAAPLDILFQRERLGRMFDLERMGADAFTVDALFQRLRRSIWSELGGASTIDSHRRSLQAAHLERLAALALDTGAPRDASALARLELRELLTGLRGASRRMRDRTSRAHLEALAARAQATLEAGVDWDDGE
jgi:hypothetical protein